jgi:hypothetical protein
MRILLDFFATSREKRKKLWMLCFHDSLLRTTIEEYGTTGNCNFCASKNIAVYDVSDSLNPISENIVRLVQLYTVSNKTGAKPLKNALHDDWDIFSAGTETILALTKKLCAAVYPDDAEIYQENVIIEQLTDKDFIRMYGAVSGYSWGDFSDSIKNKNRFHSGMFNSEQFVSILSILRSTYPAGTLMYRARRSSEKGFTKNEIGAPPSNKRTAGRINPDGIGVLYLSSDKLTALNEVRASAFDFITIGKFQAVRDISVVNLSGFDKTSPFQYVELESFAVNRKVFKEIAEEIAKPLRRNDSPLEYLPTQYIAEFIKNQNYDGVQYTSTLRQGGNNLAVFDEASFECIDVETVEVSKILYETKPELKKEDKISTLKDIISKNNDDKTTIKNIIDVLEK